MVDLPEEVRHALVRFRALLDERFGDRVHEVALFGSHARGEADEDSDVDVLVVIDELTEAERRVVYDLAYDAQEPARYVALSALVFSTAEAAEQRRRQRLLMSDIAREGVAL